MTQPRPTRLHPLSEQASTLLQTPLWPFEVGGSVPVPDAQSAMPINMHFTTLGGQGPPQLQPPGSQPLLSQAAGLPNESNALNWASCGRSTRSGVKVACINCRKAAKRCDAGRPCSRCQTLGLEGSCRDAPTKRKKSESFRVDAHGVLPTRTLIRFETAFIDQHRHWQVTRYDPVSGAAWSTFFMSREVRAISTTFTETRFLTPPGQPPAFHAQQVGMPGEVAPQYPGSVTQGANLHVPAIAPAARPQMIGSGHPTAHYYHVNTQAPRYHLPPGGAPPIEAPHPYDFYGQPYPNPGPAVDPRFNYALGRGW